MAWTKNVGPTGSTHKSSDAKARIRRSGPIFLLQVPSAPKGQRLDAFSSLIDAQEAYDTGDRSKGHKAKRAATP